MFNLGDIVLALDTQSCYGTVIKLGITDRMVYIEWFEDCEANGWFPTNILMKVS